MPARGIDEPPFDLLSNARPGPGWRDRLTPAQLQQIARTVSRTPEVMVKVLSHGASDLGAVRRHLKYIGRNGDVHLETDDGQRLRGGNVCRDLIDDWDLELDGQRARAYLVSRPGRQPPRLVHKLVFSMPAGTPSDKVLEAGRNFCREEFALKHRYAMALHTDEPHPHVHVVVRAVSEHGQRLNIRKATLRQWRSEFARHLRAIGVPANATQRFMRGEMKSRKSDPIYRANLRGESTHMHKRSGVVARDMSGDRVQFEPGRAPVVATRHDVQCAWWEISESLIRERQQDLAERVRRFANEMCAPATEREGIAGDLHANLQGPRTREG